MSSFEFKFDGKKPQTGGKVFARKRPAPNTSNTNKTTEIGSKTSVFGNINTETTGFRKNNNFVNKNTGKSFEKNTSNEDRPGFVKRKQKKDKQAAQLLSKEGDNTALKNLQSTNNKTTQHSLFSERKNLYVKPNPKGLSVVEKVFSADKKFSSLNIHRHLLSNLEKINFITLTNVQDKSIPVVMEGKNALIRSQTGSGKTLAYAVPIIDALQSLEPRLQRADGLQAIVVVPTRELALQTHELFGKINTFQWIVVGYLCGGENRKTEKVRLKKGVHVLIATPGRLLDHMLHTSAFKTDSVRCLVLDEADRLLDMGFKRDIEKIVEELEKNKSNADYNPLTILRNKQNKTDSRNIAESNLPPLKDPKSKSRQTVLLSATLTKGIAELAEFTMKEHIYIDALDESATVNPEHMVIPNTVKQEFLMTYIKHKLFTLSALIVAKSKTNSKTFIFMATSQMVDYHYELFNKYLLKMPKNRGKLRQGEVLLLDNVLEDSDGEEEVVLNLEIFKLHGNMDQSARKQVFTGFRAAKKGILLCTDVAARGIDVPAADSIVQYTGPSSDEDYLHRVGRTGRAGKSGSSIIFLTHEEQDYISRLQDHKVFLSEHNPNDFLQHLCDLMDEPEPEKAATALQHRYETALNNDRELHKKACFAYSSWSRFYNTYPSKLRSIFDFKKINLGHYVTSFGLKETPTSVAKIVRGQVVKSEPQRLNRKLAIHEDDQPRRPPPPKRKFKSVSLSTSEFGSGLEPVKKKKKKIVD